MVVKYIICDPGNTPTGKGLGGEELMTQRSKV